MPTPPPLSTRRAWIFDLDGTLTQPVHDFAAIRRELGLPQGEAILPALAALPPHERAWRRARLAEIEWSLAAHAVAPPDAVALLDALSARGRRLGVLTRNLREVALHTLETCGLAHHFHPDHVLGRECADPKPSPEGIARLLVAWGADPGDAVMVGDYRDDAETGRAAGVATVLVRRRHHHAEHEADYVVDRLDALIGALDPPTSPPCADG